MSWGIHGWLKWVVVSLDGTYSVMRSAHFLLNAVHSISTSVLIENRRNFVETCLLYLPQCLVMQTHRNLLYKWIWSFGELMSSSDSVPCLFITSKNNLTQQSIFLSADEQLSKSVRAILLQLCYCISIATVNWICLTLHSYALFCTPNMVPGWFLVCQNDILSGFLSTNMGHLPFSSENVSHLNDRSLICIFNWPYLFKWAKKRWIFGCCFFFCCFPWLPTMTP